MVYCCVPQCGTDSWRCDPSITFHEFPSKPDLAAKWIQQINSAIKSYSGHMWFPTGKPVICSKHFLSTDFKDDSDSLKPKVLPTVFGHKYIGQHAEITEIGSFKGDGKAGPLIVKIKTEEDDIQVSGICSQAEQLEAIINEPENIKQLEAIINEPENTKQLEAIINEPENITPNNTQSMTQLTDSNPLHTNRYQPISNMGIKRPKFNSVKKKNVTTNNKTSGVKDKVIQKNKTMPSAINKVVQKNKTTPSVIDKVIQKNITPPDYKNIPKCDGNDNNLIEIGPNTFLKINPDIIKVNKKQTPSGNTVLQFLMDQKLANTIGADVLPKIVQGAISNIGNATSNVMKSKSDTVPSTNSSPPANYTEQPKEDAVVQHVLGHLVDTHVCKESCEQLQEIEDSLMETDKVEQRNQPTLNLSGSNSSSPGRSDQGLDDHLQNGGDTLMETANSQENADSSCIAKAPVLMTTNMSLAHCFMEKTKYLSNLRQKARQISSLKQKVSLFKKKIEELEDKCVVQERQLSFSFLKCLRTVRKNANKGDPPATFILEQIRAYTGQKQMRWSDSTLNQCAIWCKKAPYAYEYFKKADFFKLPCLGTVKRYMKKHTELTFTNKTNSNPTNDDDNDSSSDFDFDEEESGNEESRGIKDQDESIMCETILTEEASSSGQQSCYEKNSTAKHRNKESSIEDAVEREKRTAEKNISVQNIKMENSREVHSFPVTVSEANLELQELILPSGEVVQCYSSNISSGAEGGNQYYIIPSAGDQDSGVDHEYSIVHSAESVPMILRNIDRSQLHQEQLIFITNSSDQVECTETEVATASKHVE